MKRNKNFAIELLTVFCAAMLSLSSCSDNSEEATTDNNILESLRVAGVDATINRNGVVTVKIPYSIKSENLPIELISNAEKVTIDGKTQTPETTVSLDRPVEIRLYSDQGTTSYTLAVVRSELPTIYVTSEEAGKTAYIADPHGIPEEILKGERICMTETSSDMKPDYRMDFESSVTPAGIAKGKQWGLSACNGDASYLREALGHELTLTMGVFKWAPKGNFVDLVIDGDYKGLYYLHETVNNEPTRMNISTLTADDCSEYAVQGGYLLQGGINIANATIVQSNYVINGYSVIYPDYGTLNLPQSQYIDSAVEFMEAALTGMLDPETKLRAEDIMNIDTFAGWWIINEVASNSDIANTYDWILVKDRMGKIEAGPIERFSSETFRLNDNWALAEKIWVKDFLHSSEWFRESACLIWNRNRSRLITLLTYIEMQVQRIEEAAANDAALYGRESTLRQETVSLTEYLSERINTIDRLISTLKDY